MVIEQLNPHACRTYLIGEEGSEQVALVDPVLEHVDDYLRLLEERGLKLTHVIDTHTHADHISGAAALRDRTDCEYVMTEKAPAQCVTVRLGNGYVGKLGSAEVRVVYTPGHTQDAMSLLVGNGVLTGDALFLDEGGAGRDDLPGGDPAAHWESIQELMKLPHDLVVYPAHEYRGREPSSLEAQKQSNPHLKPRSKEEFVQYIEDLKLGPAEWMEEVLEANYACARDPKAAWIPTDVAACEVKGTLEHGVNDLQVESMGVEELMSRLGSGDGPLLLDVRESEELTGELGHLPGIVHIPIAALAKRLGELEAEKEREIVTVCRSGARAHTAAQIMAQAGFGRVRVLDGGLKAWREAGYPVETK